MLAVAVTPLLYTYEMDGAGGIKWMESEVRS